MDEVNYQSMSISSGEYAGGRHNIDAEYRKGLTNVDPERTHLNVTLLNEDPREMYEARFGDAVRAYNEKQIEKKHPERQIKDYMQKLKDGKQEKWIYELVVQIGRRDTNPATDKECRETSIAIYTETFRRFRKRFTHFDFTQGVIHVDEAASHMHIDYFPWCDRNKRGLEVKNSHSRAIKQMGFDSFEDMNRAMFEILEEVAAEYGIERVDMGLKGKRHMDVREFKQACNEAEKSGYEYNNDPRLLIAVEQTQEQIAELQQIVEEQHEFIEQVANGNALKPWEMSKLAKIAASILDKHKPKLESLREMLAEWRAAFVDLPTRWRECIINPVTDKLHEARWREAERVAQLREQRERERIEREIRREKERYTPTSIADAAKSFTAGRGNRNRSSNQTIHR